MNALNLTKQVVVHWDKNLGMWRVYSNGEQVWAKTVELINCLFFVQPEGNEIVRERKTSGMTEKEARFPHAFVIGTLATSPVQHSSWTDLDYNPFNHTSFMAGAYPVSYAQKCKLLENGKGKVLL